MKMFMRSLVIIFESEINSLAEDELDLLTRKS